MNRIKELPKSSSHLLSCTQVITSAQSIVKELLENALDSQATSIEIKLENFGFEKIEVKDNGNGILKDDIHFVAKPHCTSKITSHLDLVKINTYGFRGEALAAVSAVADLAITTRTANEDFGYTYTFDHNGNILSSNPYPCNKGTSVVVTNLFSKLPVRKQLYRSEKKKKEELKMIEDTLVGFGCILMKTRLVLYHNRSLIWQKSVVDRTIDGLHLALGDAANYMENCEYIDEETRVKIEVFLPKCNSPPICGQTLSNRSIVSINKRPVRMKNIDKLLKEYYSKSLREGSKARYPVCYVSIEVPTTDIDINYEPNKTAVLLHNMDIINEPLSKLLSTFYDTGLTNENNGFVKTTSEVIPPVIAEHKISKISGNPNLSFDVDKENGTPCFHSNPLHSAGVVPSNKPKENLVLTKKLSRKNEFLTPSNKKIRTTSSFSTPPNDIYRHINTLETFFSPENSSSGDHSKSNSFSVSEPNVEKSSKSIINSECAASRNENIVNHQNSVAVTVQRKNNSMNGDNIVILDSFEEALSKNTAQTSMKNSSLFGDCSNISKNCSVIFKDSTSKEILKDSTSDKSDNNQTAGASVQNSSLFSDNSTLLNNCKEILKDSCSDNNETAQVSLQNSSLFSNSSKLINNRKEILEDSCADNNQTAQISEQNCNLFSDSSKFSNYCKETLNDFCSDTSDNNQTGSLQINELNKNSFISALAMIGKERNLESQKNTSTLDEKAQEAQRCNSNLDTVASDPSTSDEWSRGHAVENIQPVAVLKPKVAKADTKRYEIGSDVECVAIPEPSTVSVIQRKITPFDFFCRKHRLEVASLNPGLSNQQIAGILSEKWNRLPSEEKAIYKNMVSKDYPKNVRNKDRLGKIVSENVNKIKNPSTMSKKMVKNKRRKHEEKSITFEMQHLITDSSLRIENIPDENLKVINCLAPGIWICSQKNKLYLLNCYRLQEAIIYFRLLETYEFEAEQLESSFILSSSSLGNDALDVMQHMDVLDEYGSKYISDKRLTSNGFKMKILQGCNDIQVEVIGMTTSMAFYGVSDLKEILLLIKEKGIHAKLSDCRPGKAILYLQGEAVRIARQSLASKKIEDIEDLLKEIHLLPSKTCIHSKPFLHELYKINHIANTNEYE